MLSWIATPGSASVHVDLMQAQVPDATTSAKMRYSLKAHQSKKGRAWRIGYKAHIGVDAGSGLVHGVETIA